MLPHHFSQPPCPKHFRYLDTMTTDSDFMFHDFTFPPNSRRSPATYPHNAGTPSSYSYSSQPQAVSSSDLSLLAHQFSQQSIRHETYSSYSTTAQPSYQPAPSTANSQYSPQNTYTCAHNTATIRSQRQANTRLQCDPSHAREISSLVERMIASGDQCLVCSPDSYVSSPQPDDEGVADMSDGDNMAHGRSSHTLSYRRSSDFGSSHYVTKKIRVRKDRRQKSDPSRWKSPS